MDYNGKHMTTNGVPMTWFANICCEYGKIYNRLGPYK